MAKPVFVVLMLVVVSGYPQTRAISGFDKMLYISQNDTLPYRFLQPLNAGAQKKFPLVIFLHGAGERGRDNDVQVKHITPLFLDPENRDRYSCFVLAPQCPAGRVWAAHDRDGARLVMRDVPTPPMATLIQLIAEIEEHYPVDRQRIYVTGLSMGGYGTWDLIARFPERFAAAVPICGGGDSATAAAIKDVPIWAFHGALDKVVAPRLSREMVGALRNAGANPGYTEYPDVGHNSWVHAYSDPNLLPWLFNQRLKKRENHK